MEWIEQLKRGYAPKRGCKEVYAELIRCKTKDEAMAIYMEQYQWCLENDYPSYDIIKREFSGFENRGVFVDKKFNHEVFKGQVGVFHNCSGTLNVEMDYENAVMPMLYFANGCRMTIVCEQDNIRPIRVPLYIFGDCHISAKDDDNAEFLRYNHELL